MTSIYERKNSWISLYLRVLDDLLIEKHIGYIIVDYIFSLVQITSYNILQDFDGKLVAYKKQGYSTCLKTDDNERVAILSTTCRYNLYDRILVENYHVSHLFPLNVTYMCDTVNL